MRWYYADHGRTFGPFSKEDFENLIREGRINRDTLIWRAGFDDWQPLRNVASDELEAYSEGAPDLILSGSCPLCDSTVKVKYWGDTVNADHEDICPKCGTRFPLYADREFIKFVCPKCNTSLPPSSTRCTNCSNSLVPARCPRCASADLLVVTPSKPGLFAPVTFSGILLSAASSALADSIYTDFYRCRSCGQEWK